MKATDACAASDFLGAVEFRPMAHASFSAGPGDLDFDAGIGCKSVLSEALRIPEVCAKYWEDLEPPSLNL